MYSTYIAYLLWFLGGFGTLGLYRFYLGRFGTGILWFFTGGLRFLFGAVPDLFRIPSLVEQANALLSYRQEGGRLPRRSGIPLPSPTTGEAVERPVLRPAKADGGVLTPATVADAAGCTLQDARAELER